MQFLKLVLSFAPWLAFLLIARHSLFQVKVGLIVAFALAIGLGVARLNRGVMLWAGLLFFAYATVAVAVLNDMWTLKYMGVLANGTLTAATWFTIAIKRPFTLDYSREHTDPSLWNDPIFIKTNYVIAAVWGTALGVNTALAFAKTQGGLAPEIAYDALSYGCLIGSAIFTTWYPKYVHKKHANIGPPAL